MDHGKSSLLERLTGRNPMHLPEEFSRGLTIELGFGYWKSPEGIECGVVDVPGHGHFIRNMAGGAFALDAAIFVVAADDGWKPQSEEHLFILNAARVPAGIVAINKSDLVSDERISELADELEIRLEGTFLEGAPVIPVSAVTGTGMDKLEAALGEAISKLPPQKETGIVRLWIDRAFKIEGAGSVITGTLRGGTLKAGDHLTLLPSGEKVRARKLQMHGRDVPAAPPGSRVAVNVAGGAKVEIERGMLLCAGSEPPLTKDAWVVLKKAPSWDAKIKPGGRYLAHVGTRSEEVRIFMRKAEIAGGRAAARIAFDAYTPLERGMNFQIFSSAKHGVVASCDLALPVAATRSHREQAGFDSALADSLESTRQYVEFKVAGQPLTTEELSNGAGADAASIETAINKLENEGKVCIVKHSGATIVLMRDLFEKIEKHIIDKAMKFRGANPGLDSISPAQLEPPPRLDAKVFAAIMAKAAAKIEGASFSGGVIQFARQAQSNILDDPRARAIMAKFRGDVAAFPSLRQLYDLFPRDKRVIGLLVEQGHLVKLPDEMLLPPALLEKLTKSLVELIKRKGEIGVADAKDALGVTRKHVIPLLEFFDARGITARTGNVRIKGPKFGD